MCSCPAHNALVDCECQCDHTHDRLAQWHDRALAAEAEIARLRAGEADEPAAEGTELTPAQWIRRWNDETAEERLQRVTHIRTAFRAWRECEETDHRGRLEHAEGELSSRIEQHQRAVNRATAAETTIADVRRLCDMTIATSCRAQAIDQATDTLAVLDRALTAPESHTERIADEKPTGVHAFEQNPAATQVSVCICGLWRDHHVHGADPCGCDACRTPGDAEEATDQ